MHGCPRSTQSYVELSGGKETITLIINDRVVSFEECMKFKQGAEDDRLMRQCKLPEPGRLVLHRKMLYPQEFRKGGDLINPPRHLDTTFGRLRMKQI